MRYAAGIMFQASNRHSFALQEDRFLPRTRANALVSSGNGLAGMSIGFSDRVRLGEIGRENPPFCQELHCMYGHFKQHA